ncbi:uncharacterized protein LOC141693092 [Apium graveolens]|uniref:uncharacterized protein LOC141693092 n=1 Tax=Apium graveolens TaxID=4045 RepID=UPI003D791E7A
MVILAGKFVKVPKPIVCCLMEQARNKGSRAQTIAHQRCPGEAENVEAENNDSRRRGTVPMRSTLLILHLTPPTVKGLKSLDDGSGVKVRRTYLCTARHDRTSHKHF